MNEKDSDIQGNKISRLQFLRLLGAGAIGYFAYRVGFINSLLGNATATTSTNTTNVGSIAEISLSQSGAVPSAATAENLDEDGIIMMARPKPGGYSYRFNPSRFPFKDIRLDVSSTAGFEITEEGAVKFIRFFSLKPTGDKDYAARIHVFTEDRTDEDKQQYNWINGAQQMGWLTRPNDLKNGEWTFICRPNKILDNTDSITAKLGGGKHTREVPENFDASCWNVHWNYDGSTKDIIDFEFIHPKYEKDHTVRLYNTYKPLRDRWFGCKVVSMVRPDHSARDIVAYFNEDPIDLRTGKPNNDGWKKYFEFTHTGQGDKYEIPHTWGGAKNTWRIDQLTTIDVAYMNHREIDSMLD